VQGLTMKPMLRSLGITGQRDTDEHAYEVAFAKVLGSRAALGELVELEMAGRISADDRQRLSTAYQRQVVDAEAEIERLAATSLVHSKRVEQARKALLTAQIQAIHAAERSGALSGEVARDAQAELNRALSISEVAWEHIDEIEATKSDGPPIAESAESFESLVPESTEAVTGVNIDDIDEALEE